MQLTKNFSLKEMIRSKTALKHGIDNSAPPNAVKSLHFLALLVLQPVRDHFNKSVHVSSGYRCLALNTLVKSKPTSSHVKGEAADIEIFDVDNKELAIWIRDNLKFDQLILEYYDESDINSGWVHVSYVADGVSNRNEVLTVTSKGTMHGIF